MTPASRPPGTLRTSEGALLWADYRGDALRWHQLRPRLEATGVTAAAAGIAAHRRFHGVRELREVAWFVAAHNAAAPDEHLLPRLEAEAFVRAALGEPHLLDAVDRGTRAEVARGLLLTLADDLRLDDRDVHDLLADAEAVAQTQAEAQARTRAATEPAGYPRAMGWRPRSRVPIIPAPRLPDAMAALVDGDLEDARARALRIAAGPRSREGRWLRALLLNHRGRAAAGVERRAEPVTVALVDRAFVAAVTHHFAPDADLRAIAVVVRGIREAYGEAVPLLETEALIRRALGEDTSAYVLEDRLGLVTRATVLLGLAELWADDLTIVNTVVAEAEELCRLDGLTPTVGG